MALTAAVLTAVLGVGLVACGGGSGAGSAEKTVLALFSAPGATTIHVALENGYFEDEGLEVRVKSYESGRLALESVMAGEADFATVAETPIVRAVLDGQPVTIIATISTLDGAISIIARKDRGIADDGDLKGKRVGMAPGTISEFFLDAFLTTHGISPTDVQIVPISPDRFIDALPEGDVDAVALVAPYRVIVRDRLGDNAVVLEDPALVMTTLDLATTPQSAESNPERVEKLLSALVRADRYVEEHPEEARVISLKYMSGNPSLYETEWPLRSFKVTLDQRLVAALEDQARWMIGKDGGGVAVPNFLDFIYADGLRAVEADAVTIVGK